MPLSIWDLGFNLFLNYTLMRRKIRFKKKAFDILYRTNEIRIFCNNPLIEACPMVSANTLLSVCEYLPTAIESTADSHRVLLLAIQLKVSW